MITTLERLIPKVGERIRGYELIEEIGRGGFGVVFRARQTQLDADVAIKVLLPLYADEDRLKDHFSRFEQEAKLSKQLSHPCAIKVRDFGRTESELPFLVTEFIEGRDLDEVIYDEVIDSARLVRIVTQILGCLAEAHHRGIIHRDLKPSNIKLRDIYGEPDSVTVLDFGIAKVSSQLGGVETKTGASFGTPYYMSPEQCRGLRDLDGRADLYSLGLMMAECIGRRRIVDGIDTMAIVYAHARPEPHKFTADVQQSPLFAVIEKATAKDRDERYPDALAMKEALLDVVGVKALESSYKRVERPQPPSTSPDVQVIRPLTPNGQSSSELFEQKTKQHDSTGQESEVKPGAEPSVEPRKSAAPPLKRGLVLLAIALFAVVAVALYAVYSADDRGLSTHAAAEPVQNEPDETEPVQNEPDESEPVQNEPGQTVIASVVAKEVPEMPPVESNDAVEDTPALEEGSALDSAPQEQTITARIEGTPANARIRLGSDVVCRELPCTIEVEQGEGSERLRISARGYDDDRLRISLEQSDSYQVRLEREPEPELEIEPEREPIEEPIAPTEPSGPSLPEVPVFGGQ